MWQKVFFYLCLIFFSFFIILGVMLVITSNSIFDIELNPDVTKEKMITNYSEHEEDILNLKKFFNSITPSEMEVNIEYESNSQVDLKIYYVTNPKFPRKIFFEQWSIDPYNYKPESRFKEDSVFFAETNSLEEVKRKLKWNDDTFRKIKNYLDKANCISVTNGEPCNIGFGRSGMGMYFYNVFDTSISKEEQESWNDSCQYILYNDKLVLEYGGGVMGPDCFPDP